MRSRWQKIYENSQARLNKELKLRELQQERKRSLSEQRYSRAKALWSKNERKNDFLFSYHNSTKVMIFPLKLLLGM